MSYRDDELRAPLVGRTVLAIRMDAEHLIFETDEGPVGYGVEGDCCSHSFFYDFVGLDKLRGSKIVSMGEITDEGSDAAKLISEPTDTERDKADSLGVYGYEFVTEHPEFGEVTSVMSFRNDSNGYYGGEMTFWGDNTVDLVKMVEENTVPALTGDHGTIADA